uniref:Uncharacterized protein n=1 Tax=Lepeophtheirus salmonis TaxID=72036 RepID=A0A0K2UTC1_LEPSM
MRNYGWYLTQELITIPLFSSQEFTSHIKQKLAIKLSKTEKMVSYRKGTPVIPVINQTTSLIDLVGPESHFSFFFLTLSD